MRRIIFFLALIFFSGSLSGWTQLPQQTRTIRVGVYENAPKIYTAEDGTVSGFWPDLIRYIATEEGWEINWVHGTWEEGLERLETNEIDIMPDTGWTEERSQKFAFSNETILISWTRLYVPRDSDITSILDLEGKTIAGLTGSFNLNGPEGIKDLTAKFGIHSTFVEMTSYTQIFEALENNEVDAGITNKDFGNLNEGNYAVVRTPIIFQPARIQFAFTKDAPLTPYLLETIDAHMKTLKEDRGSVYYQALDEYLGEKASGAVVEVIPEWTKNLLMIGGGAIVFLLALAGTSRIQVRRSTKELRASLQKREELEFIVNRSQVIVFLWRVAEGWPVEYVSESVRQLGYEPEDFTEGRISYVGIIHPDDLPWVEREVAAYTARGENEFRQEYRILTKSGEIRWTDNATRIRRDKNRVITHYQGTVTDITVRKQAEDEIRRHSAALATLLQSSQALASTLDMGNVLQASVDSVVALTELKSAAVYLLNGEILHLWATTPPLSPQFPDEWRNAQLADHPHLRETIDTGLPVFLPDTATADLTPVERAVSDLYDLRSILYLPLLAGTEALGILIATSTGEPRALSETEIALCRTLANLSVLSIENVQLFEASQHHVVQLERSAEELAALNVLGQDVSATLSLDEVVSASMKGVLNASHPDLAYFFLRDGDRLIKKMIAPEEAVIRLGEFPEHRIGECLCGSAVTKKRALYSKDLYQDMRCTWNECKEAGAHSFAALPLLSDNEVIGVIGLASDEERDFETQAEFLETLTNTVSVSLRNALLYEEIRQYATDLEQRVAERTAELNERVAESETLTRAMIALTEDLQNAVKKAESADQLKSAFLAIMSHELRTPLNSIIGFTGILLQGLVGSLNAEQAKQLGMVQDSARHLLNLINDILDISKIEAGQVEVRFEPFDIRAAIHKTVERIKPLATKKELSLSIEIAPQVGEIISDQRRVEQIIINLLSNAVKFTDQGEVRIESFYEDKMLVIRVADTGIGIRSEDVEKLFEPFKQIDTGITREHDGTGLGLSICRHLLELLGGKIWVESEYQKGSVFSFSLPVERTPDDN